MLSGLTVNAAPGGSFGVDPPLGAAATTETFGFAPPARRVGRPRRRVGLRQVFGWWAVQGYGDVVSPWGAFGAAAGQGDMTVDRRHAVGGPPMSVAPPAAVTVSATTTNLGSGWSSGARATFLADKLDLHLSDTSDPALDATPAASAVFGPANPSGWYTTGGAILSATARDLGAGVRYLLVRDGATVRRYPVAPASPTCRTFDTGQFGGNSYTVAQPCPAGAAPYALTVDLAALGDGTHTLRVGVQDAAGNAVFSPTEYVARINAPGGTLADPGTPCLNGTVADSGVRVPRPPVTTSPPALSGIPAVGHSLATDPGAWNDIAGVTWSYAWERCGTDGGGCVGLSGASTATLPLTSGLAGFRLRSVVSATTNWGTVRARSSLSPVVEATAGGGGAAGGVTEVDPRGGGGGTSRPRPQEPDLPVPPPAARTEAERILNGDGADDTAPRLTVAFTGAGRTLATRRWGTTVEVRGRLATAPGTPIRRAQVDVLGQVLVTGARGSVLGAVHTDDQGAFRYTVPAGVSQIVTFGYRRTLADRTYATTASVQARTRAGIVLRSGASQLRNGGSLLLRGRVRARLERRGSSCRCRPGRAPLDDVRHHPATQRRLRVPLPVHAHADDDAVPAPRPCRARTRLAVGDRRVRADRCDGDRMRGLATWVSAVAVAVVAAVSAAGAPVAWANAEGPGTPQATAANATFLSSLPAPPGGAAGVCVIDSGVDTDTDLGPALAGRTALLGGVPGDPSDQGATLDTGVTLPKHGTYVAGVIASQVDGVGTSGIWPAAKVYSSRVFAGGQSAKALDYMRALNWCVSVPAVDGDQPVTVGAGVGNHKRTCEPE